MNSVFQVDIERNLLGNIGLEIVFLLKTASKTSFHATSIPFWTTPI
jgi:hypothetical protein